MIKDLINNSYLQEYCQTIKYYGLNNGAKLCGIDVKEDYLNFKLYTELLEVPSTEIIATILGTKFVEDFVNWAQFWDTNRKSSLAFGFKIDTQDIYKKYFHVKFKPDFEKILFETKFLFLKALKINVNSLLKGISYEIISEEKYYVKFYVYVKDPQQIRKVLSYKNMKNLDINEIEELELYATKDSFKVNVINKLDNFTVKQRVWETIPDKFKQTVKECESVLECSPIYTGITSQDVVSAYFSFTNKPVNILNI